MKKLITGLAAVILMAGLAAAARAADPLKLVAKYNMPATVKSRFDHLGVDLRGNRLFLTAESMHEVLVFNLRNGKYLEAIPGIDIPHAVFTREDLNLLYVTDGGAGEVKKFDARTYRLLGAAKLKVDSDSIGYDPATHYLYIVNGGGDAHETFSMLSVVDTSSGEKVADIQIDGNTLEALALAHTSARLYVNNPSKSLVDVIDRDTRSVLATWPVTLGKRNVAMALDEPAHRLFIACRNGVLVVMDTETGKELQSLPIGQGVDDLVFDPVSKRLYAACGSDGGTVAVYHEDDPDHYTSLGQIPSAPGGKNEIFVPQLKRLFITTPPRDTSPGAVYVYQVQ